ARDLVYAEAAEDVENERDLRLLCQARLAAGEHHPKQIVFALPRDPIAPSELMENSFNPTIGNEPHHRDQDIHGNRKPRADECHHVDDWRYLSFDIAAERVGKYRIPTLVSHDRLLQKIVSDGGHQQYCSINRGWYWR